MKKVTVDDGTFRIIKVSAGQENVSVLCSINIDTAKMEDNVEINVTYPNGDDLYSIEAVQKKITTNFERPVQVSNDGEIHINRTAENIELLEAQVELLKDICDSMDIFGKSFILKSFSTTRYTEGKGGISIQDNLKSLIKKSPNFEKTFSELITLMKENELIPSTATSSRKQIKNSEAKKKTAGKISKILDSLFPECDIEMRFPENTIMESSKIKRALNKVFKK